MQVWVVVLLFVAPWFGAAQAGMLEGQAVVALPPVSQLVALPDDYVFSVWRKGRQIGQHEISFQRLANNDLEVKVALNIRIAFGPIPLFRYQHRNREVWRAGRLVMLESMTTQNGQTFEVQGRAREDGFWLTGSQGEQRLSVDIVTSNYWNPALVKQRQLLDTQSGRIIEIMVEDLGYDSKIGAMKYMISGDLDLDIWYQKGRLEKMKFTIDRTQIDYRPLGAER